MSNQSAEDRLIARYFAPIAKDPGALGLVDDAAVLVPPADCDLVIKTDPIVASVHFFPDDPPAAIARKARACRAAPWTCAHRRGSASSLSRATWNAQSVSDMPSR